mmetsp:Transcript_3546/g.6486  ORF Transcript_3546/g.6486 Transcript_3546/m.6486 type:complete len:314 (-) Transcript_3546:463-1404(-)
MDPLALSSSPSFFHNNTLGNQNNSSRHSKSSSIMNAMSSSSRSNKKQVSFSLQQTAYFWNPNQQDLHPEERKAICWYSDAELSPSREDARAAILALQRTLNELEGEGSSSSSSSNNSNNSVLSIDSLVIPCPQDPTQILCLRGIEKYADAAAKFAGQKRLVGSVLHQQNINKQDVPLVSQTLSQPFKDVARYYAVKSAQEQEELRRQEEEDERRRAVQQHEHQMAQAAMLFLFVGQQQQQQHRPDDAGSEESSTVEASNEASSCCSVRTLDSPQDAIGANNKRARDASCSHEADSLHGTHRRNVKPCVRVISE